MKTSKIDARVDFHVVLRIIPETLAYSVTIGEIQDGQFIPTDRRPESYPFDWQEVKANPLIPSQSYVAASVVPPPTQAKARIAAATLHIFLP